ncbi:MAG: isoprenyl transferase [Clostridiales bacterium]|nr:isoprenyl transferase [Clostridiales bacterium]
MRKDMTEKALPRHVAIIMDGNGRWAKKHRIKIALGHRRGVETLRDIIRESSDIGIEVLTLYAFSTENWSRSPEEVEALMGLLLEFFISEIDELDEKNVCIRILGEKSALPLPQQEALMKAENRTKENTGLQLNIAINYGSRPEIIRAVKTIAEKVRQGKLDIDRIDESTMSEALYTAGQPDVDLLIRTSGEQRLSNFLLWQCAYAEFTFPTVLWPDFTLKEYHAALDDYMHRDRRFGGRKE